MTVTGARALAVVLLLGLAALGLGASAAAAGDPSCVGDYSGTAPGPPATLRFGVDPGIAGSAGSVQLSGPAEDPGRELSALQALRPPGRVLVARLNRLFWSDGEAGIQRFRAQVAQLAGAGIDSEIQVRYHPPSGHDGDLAGWTAYVRHVVDELGSDPHVVAMTVTNEVNIGFSPNTSDGAYTSARDALIQGVEAAHDEALRRNFRQLQFGFTYAYRFGNDSDFFSYLGAHGGPALNAALGFVGLDFYPGSIFPPVIGVGDSFTHETAQALGVVRECLMPEAGLGPHVPIWITENGVPTGVTRTVAEQAAALGEIVGTIRALAAPLRVTDYRWFNLRDTNSSPVGAVPGAAATFETDGLLRSDYSAKPAFAALRSLIVSSGTQSPPLARPRHRVRTRPRRVHHRVGPRCRSGHSTAKSSLEAEGCSMRISLR